MPLLLPKALIQLCRHGRRECAAAWLRTGLCLLFFVALPATAQLGRATPETVAQSLFGDLKRMVFQVRVIDNGSGDQYGLGSGFQVSADGFVATNYHVVSAYVDEPEKYRLEILSASGAKLPVSLRAIDVIHDLALLHAEGLDEQFLEFAGSAMSKGERIYSIGNPLDLGMTIIEGTYNGLVKRSRYQKILFSGSLNSGMSGGPAVRSDGRVIGINVSKGGEQISFLVPVARLRDLLADGTQESGAKDFHAQIREDLLADQQAFSDALLAAPFASKQLGELTIPVDLHEALRCWGHSDSEEEDKYEAVHQHCRSEDNIFIAGDLTVGSFHYDAEWVSSDELNRFQFYSFLQSRYLPSTLNGSGLKKHVSEYRCHTDFVELQGATWKATSCYRAYREFTGLFDALLLMAMVEESHSGAIIKMAASGFARDNVQVLFRAIMESVEWNR